MEDWVARALARWPDVPALYGWLSLGRHGHWHIRGEPISRPQIIDTLNRNYAADAEGRWFFQNGPQRGYVSLARAPLVLRAGADGTLHTHTGLAVSQARAGYLDEDGGLWLATDAGPAALDDHDLAWLLERLEQDGQPPGEAALAAALTTAAGQHSGLALRLGCTLLPLRRLDAADAPSTLGFVREPAPKPGEKASR